MAELAAITKDLDFQLEQVQDFTPTPMTVATEIYYTGYHPYTGEKVYTARTPQQKLAQRQFFFWYKSDQRAGIIAELRKMKRQDLIGKLFPAFRGNTPQGKESHKYSNRNNSKKHKSKY